MFAVSALAGDLNWKTDLESAKAEAAKAGKPVLAFFTGSDWCGWCKRLDSEVLSKEPFQKFASEKFVLFMADFPAKKEIPADVKERNARLSEQYEVEGFPTLLVLDKDGKVMGRTGYRPGGPEKYIEHLKAIISGKAE